MQIIDLKDNPESLQTLAQWHHVQWSYLSPERTLAQRIDEMASHLEATLVPSTWVAVENDVVMGSASLLHDDMHTHPELSPWLASVFIAPKFRRRGIAAKLVLHVMQQARAGGIETLYLFTPDQAALYAKLGWQLLRQEAYAGDQVTLMHVAL